MATDIHGNASVPGGSETLIRNVVVVLREMTGKVKVTIKQDRANRSSNANRWYWGCIVSPFAAFLLRERSIDAVTMEQAKEAAHEILKARFLVHQARDRKGWLIARYVGSSTRLSTEEFSIYCENCRAFLAEVAGIDVPDPDSNWQAKPEYAYV